jgi:hypothetical protein
MPLFEYAIILKPTKDEANAGAGDKIVAKPDYLCAKDQTTATILASRKIPDDLLSILDRVEVAVRPF